VDGTRFEVFPLHDVSRAGPRPKRCAAELRRRVTQAIAGRPAAFRRVARRLLRNEIAEYWLPRRREGLLVFASGGGPGLDLATFRRRGAMRLDGAGTGRLATFYGVVPDGVARIDFTFRRFEPTGYWSKHHPVTYRSTGSVSGNVVSYTAPTSLRDGIYGTEVWRASDGSVIRVVRG
jgi:hypothetical protein